MTHGAASAELHDRVQQLVGLGAVATIVLIFAVPCWITQPPSALTIIQIEIADRTLDLGLPLLLAVLATLATVVARRPQPKEVWRQGLWTSLAILAYGAWILVRIRPVHLANKAFVAAASVAILWTGYVWVRLAVPPSSFVKAYGALLAVQGLIAVAQFGLQRSLGLAGLCEATLDPQILGVSVVEAAGERWLRGHGLMPHPNILGGYLAMWGLVCLGALLDQPRGAIGQCVWLWIAILAGAAGLLCSFSRSALLGGLAGLVYLFAVSQDARRRVRSIFRRRIALALLACALVALILAGFAPGKLFASRVLRTESALESASVRERVEDVSLAWTLIRAQPLIGVGPGYYEAALWAAVGNSQPPGFPGFRVVHNLPLLVLAELGMIGFLLWLAWVLGPVVQRIQWPADRMWGPTAAGVSAAWVGLLAIGLFDGYMHVPASWWSAAHLGLLAGAWGRLQAEAAIAGAARDAS